MSAEAPSGAQAYLRWLEAKVAAVRADGGPYAEHDEAMKEVRATFRVN